MQIMQFLEDSLPLLLTLLLLTASCALIFLVAHWLRIARRKEVDGKNVLRQLVCLLSTAIILGLALLILWANKETRELATQLAGLLGILLSAAITISSATFISNAMAGLMLRALRNFSVGDFVRVGDKFGRVSERGLFHVELQTEERDLATLPNLYLVSQPVTVVRASGTIVSTTVSLGYGEAHDKVEVALKQAALDAKLEEPLVYILELGDFAITYQIAALLPKVTHLLSARSRLRTCVLDALHTADIEIVSPTYMNQRQAKAKVIPPAKTQPVAPAPEEPELEKIRFDKAELAKKIADVEGQLAEADDEKRSDLEAEIQRLKEQLASSEERDEDKSKTVKPNICAPLNVRPE